MRKQSLGLFFILPILLFVVSPIAFAVELPTCFEGNASVNGVTVVTGTNISAWVGSSYKFSVIADSSATPVYFNLLVECVLGETINFTINNLTALETHACNPGDSYQLSLTATDDTPPGISITSPSADQILDNKEIEINGTSSDSGYGLDYTNISIYNSAGSLINSTVKTQTLNYTNSWSKNLSVSVDGNYTINATAYDLAGNSNSDTVNITVDSTAPTVLNVSSTKDNGTYKAGEEINITVTFSEVVNVIGIPNLELELGDIDQDAVYIDGTGTTILTFNYTVQEEDLSFDLNYTSTSALTAGTSIKDAAGNDANLTLPTGDESLAGNKDIVIDAIPPTITHLSPGNNSWTNEDTPSFSFTVIDDIPNTMSCELIIGGEGFGVNSSVLNGTLTTITANHSTNEIEGINNRWYINCTDQAGNIGEPPDEWVINIDYTKPEIELHSPNNNLNTSSSTINFNWNVTDNWGINGGEISGDIPTTNLSCYLTINGVINETTVTSEGEAINYSDNVTYSISDFNNGDYYWNITCMDNASNTKTSDTYFFTVDAIDPIITPIYPSDDQFINMQYINFSVNTTGSRLRKVSMILNETWSTYNPDNYDGETPDPLYDITCNSTNDPELYYCNMTTSLSDGTYWANITAWDSMENNYTYPLNFTIDATEPTVNMINSSFNTTNTQPNIYFNFTDFISSTANCTLYFNDSSAGTNATTANNTNTNITASTQDEGIYTVYVNCTDEAGNLAKSNNITIIIDTTAPLITAISHSSVTSSGATLAVTTNENANCAYTNINSSVEYVSMTPFSTTGGTSHSTSLGSLSASTSYTYYVRCNDTLGNVMTSSNFTTFTTLSSGGGSPGGGGGGTPTTTTIISFTTAGVDVSLRNNYIAKFAFSGAYHTIKATKVGADYVTLRIASTPVIITLKLLESKKLDLNNDNYYDLYVKLNEIKSSKAYLTVKYIHEIITPVVTPPAEEEEEEPEEVPEEEPEEEPEEPPEEVPPEEVPPAKPKTAMIIVLIAALLALIGYLIYEKKKRY